MIIKHQRKTEDSIDYLDAMLKTDRWVHHPFFVLMVMTGCIFVTEVCIELLLYSKPVIFAYMDINFFHTAVLTLIVLPELYLLVLRPQATLRR